MLNILLMIILLIIILIFIILALGIRITIEWSKINSELDGCGKILILKKLKVYSFDLKSEDDEEEDSDDEEKKRDIKKLYELAKPCFDDLKIFLHKVYNAISINKLENRLVIGFSNFANTGEYIGYIWAVLTVLNTNLPNTHLQAQPSFEGRVLNFKGSLNIDISILKLIKPTFDLIMKKEVRELIKGVRNGQN